MRLPAYSGLSALFAICAAECAQAAPIADSQAAAVSAAMIVRVVDAPKPVYTAGSLGLSQPWSRATPKGTTALAQYFTITNSGKAIDRLIGCTGNFGVRCELQDTVTIGENVTMRFLDSGIELKPGKSVELKPGGYHVMMVGLKAPVKEGDKVRGSLEFEIAGSIDIEYSVIGHAALAPGQLPPPEPPKAK